MIGIPPGKDVSTFKYRDIFVISTHEKGIQQAS
jgi:hypothetical protein